MSELNWFGYWATAFLFIGTWISIEKDSYGWLFRLFGSLIWAYIGFRIHMSSLWVCELVFAWMAYLGYKKWSKQEPTGNEWTDEQLLHPTEVGGFPFTYDKPIWTTAANTPITFTYTEETNGENKDIQCQSEGKDLATKSSRTRKTKVQSSGRRRSVKTNGKPRSRPNVKSKGTKGSRRNVRVQKNDRRTNVKGSKTGKV